MPSAITSWESGEPTTRHPPILFVHGIMHGAWCWSGPWRRFFGQEGLVSHWMNLPGRHGGATERRNLRWTSLAEYADAVVRAAAEFEDPPILVGHSLGALLIQMRLEQLRPPAVVLLAPTHPTAFRRAAWRCFCRHPRLFLDANRRARLRLAIPTRQHCRDWFFSPWTPEEVVARCFARLEEESYRVCLELLLRPTLFYPSHRGTPVLVLGAGQDASVPSQTVERTARLYGARAEFFEDMGHDLMLEPGWPRVAGRIVGWLRGLRLAPGPHDAAPRGRTSEALAETAPCADWCDPEVEAESVTPHALALATASIPSHRPHPAP